jgi:hypothetical protein
MKKLLPLLLPCLLLAATACVDIPADELKSAGVNAPARRPLTLQQAGISTGLVYTQTLHFTIYAADMNKAEAYGKIAEHNYETIMQNTGLYSFLQENTYEIAIYANHADYISKTSQPEWSGGVTINNAIALYDSPDAARIMAHEMTHLVFNEFMVRPRQDLRWLNEGLAVYDETAALDDARLYDFRSRSASAMKASSMPITMVTAYIPAQDDPNRLVDTWYMQCESLVRFMIETEGQFTFSTFLSKIKNGTDLDTAIQQAWHGKWQGMADVDAAWRKSLGIT